MQIRLQESGLPRALPKVPPSREEEIAPATAKDVVLLGQIRSQETVVGLSHGVPWVTALATSSLAYYLAEQSLKVAGLVGLPLGLLLGAGLAEVISGSAIAKIQGLKGQLSSASSGQEPPTS